MIVKNKLPIVFVIAVIVLTVSILSQQKQITNASKTVPATNKETPTPTTISESVDQLNIYTNQNLGIKFDYNSDEFKNKLKTKNNQIYFQYENSGYIDYIEIYSKKSNQTIEEAILDIVKSKGKNPANCKIKDVTDPILHPNYSLYIIDLANPNITYTKEELAKIEQGKKEGKDVVWFETTDYIKKEIYNFRLIETCSEYADRLGLATSVTTPSRFLFNNKNKFVFLPGSADPNFYQESTVELFD